MASPSNTSTYTQLEEPAPSTSASGESDFKMEEYKPPTTKLALRNDKRYHVFLSFRGPDVRNTLVKDLFKALSTAGLNVFVDSEKLEKGNFIDYLFEEIKSSAIHVPIFSERYAESAWCLREAAAISTNSDLIIPLFYRMEPTHVRFPRSDNSVYKESFDKYYGPKGRYPEKEINEWVEALENICSRSGWSMAIKEGLEGPTVQTVVNDLIKTLDRKPFKVAKHPVGLDSVKNELIGKLNLNSREEVVKVGIWGIGGIGKTTVAKAVYNQIYVDFQAASFVFDVRTTAAEAAGLINLQKQILEDLVKYDQKVHSVEHGISLFIDRLGGKRVLLILDDVDTVVQLNALVGDWLFSGSRVIITSRDKHILSVAQVSSECIHETSELGINEGLQLFSLHAFPTASPDLRLMSNRIGEAREKASPELRIGEAREKASPELLYMSRKIVEACKGHPLSLEVIGSLLHDKQSDTSCWIEALRNITLNPNILKRFYISYSALSDDEKEIFVDIACFFVGEHKRFPILFWKSMYEMVDTAICNLLDKLLIQIDDKGVFKMHDHLRDMGRTIARKEKEGSRLWEAAHLSIVSNNKIFSRLQLDGVNPPGLEMLCRPGLRYLHLQNLHITESILALLPPSLIWLRLEKCLSDVGMDRARRRPRHSRFMGNIWQLKTMQLAFCNGVDGPSISSLFSLPNIQLQHLDLRECKDLVNLPDNFGNLPQLQHLDLKGCVSLSNLPHTFGNLSQLQHLDLRGCKNLNSLPDTFGNLLQLQHLYLKGCESLNNLPSTFGKLLQLQHLGLQECVRLNKLPNTFGDLSQLRHLDLQGCQSLNNLPDSIGNLSQLHHLDLRRCVKLNRLPDSFGNLSQLQHLDLEKCENLNNIRDTIGKLSRLQFLKGKDGRNVTYI